MGSSWSWDLGRFFQNFLLATPTQKISLKEYFPFIFFLTVQITFDKSQFFFLEISQISNEADHDEVF